MATNPSFFLVICTIFLTTLLIITVDASGDLNLPWIPTRSSSSSSCQGSIAECLEENEFDMDSEINRRILATNSYISYGALRRNSVPCNRRGASYYNCKPGAPANPYRRGCTAITRCRG
ncbi:hypothetical protein ACHQM5_015127 [Ranunculus cassubicifolius]